MEPLTDRKAGGLSSFMGQDQKLIWDIFNVICALDISRAGYVWVSGLEIKMWETCMAMN